MVDQEILKAAELQLQNYSKKIDFYTSEYTIEILAKKVAENEYTVPDYQREFTWEGPRKSKFIESILMGLPIPFVFFWANDETGKLEIVDGSQRLRTIEEYLSGNLVLEDLKRLDLLNGTTFNDLPLSRRRKILNISIRGIILSDNTDIEARVDLFERINTGSKVANPAEVRRGALRGAFMDFVNRLSMNELFVKLAPITSKQKKEREAEELVTRFFAYSDGLEGYKDDVSPFIFRYIKKMNDEFVKNPNLESEYEQRFTRMIKFVDESFEFGFRKSSGAKTTPRTRYESIALGSHFALEENPNLRVTIQKTTSILDRDEFKKEVSSDGANAKRKLTGRVDYMRDALLERV